MRWLCLFAVLAVLLLTACSTSDVLNRPGYVGTTPDMTAMQTTRVPVTCQSDTKGAREQGSDATYVRDPEYKEGVVRGCIRNIAGEPLPGAYTDTRPLGLMRRMTAVGFHTEKDGQYTELNIIEPGWYAIKAVAAGYEPQTKRVLVKGGHSAVLDFELEPLPPTEATAEYVALNPPKPGPVVLPTPASFPCQSESKGFTVPDSDATYLTDVSGHQGVQTWADDTLGFTIELMGCIKDRSGKGISGAKTVAKPLDPGLPSPGLDYMFETGESGRYVQTGITELGWWEITASAPGYKPTSKNVRILNNEIAVLDFVLEKKR